MSEIDVEGRIDLGPENGTLQFSSLDEIYSFIQNEIEHWWWLNENPVRQRMGALHSHIVQELSNARDLVRKHLNNNHDNDRSNIVFSLQNVFIKRNVPRSTSPRGIYIDRLKDTKPYEAAVALASWTNFNALEFRSYADIRGAFLALLYDEKISAESKQSIEESILGAVASIESQLQSLDKSARRQEIEDHVMHQKARDLFAKTIRQVRNQNRTALLSVQTSSQESIDALEHTHKVYSEHMSIKAPVDYWRTNAREHRKNAKIAFRRLQWFFGACVLGSLVITSSMIHIMPGKNEEWSHPTYILLAAGAIFMTTCLFWAGRILTKLYLSEHHLSVDADERAVMAQTYLALSNDGQAEREDRAIILAALFRPTSDGVVKDDGGPDFSIGSILSRIGTKT
ncbi:MAG: DUF6161 domain-containing protein [Alphaproteobacteria bacterium]